MTLDSFASTPQPEPEEDVEEAIAKAFQDQHAEMMRKAKRYRMIPEGQPTEREQKLVDLLFEIVAGATDEKWREWLSKSTQEDRMQWVAQILRFNGFDTEPRGSSWGVLKDGTR